MDKRKFIHEPMTTALKKNDRVSREKSVQPTVIRSSMKIIILVLEHRKKDLERPPPFPSEIAYFGPPLPSELPLPSVGREWIFSGTTNSIKKITALL